MSEVEELTQLVSELIKVATKLSNTGHTLWSSIASHPGINDGSKAWMRQEFSDASMEFINLLHKQSTKTA